MLLDQIYENLGLRYGVYWVFFLISEIYKD